MVQSGWNLRETQRLFLLVNWLQLESRNQRHPIAWVPRLWWGIIRKSRTCRWPQEFFLGVVTQGNSKDCPLQTSIAQVWLKFLARLLSRVGRRHEAKHCMVLNVWRLRASSRSMRRHFEIQLSDKSLTNQPLRTSIEELQQFLRAEGPKGAIHDNPEVAEMDSDPGEGWLHQFGALPQVVRPYVWSLIDFVKLGVAEGLNFFSLPRVDESVLAVLSPITKLLREDRIGLDPKISEVLSSKGFQCGALRGLDRQKHLSFQQLRLHNARQN